MNVILVWLFGLGLGLNIAFLMAGGLDLVYVIVGFADLCGAFVFYALDKQEKESMRRMIR